MPNASALMRACSKHSVCHLFLLTVVWRRCTLQRESLPKRYETSPSYLTCLKKSQLILIKLSRRWQFGQDLEYQGKKSCSKGTASLHCISTAQTQAEDQESKYSLQLHGGWDKLQGSNLALNKGAILFPTFHNVLKDALCSYLFFLCLSFGRGAAKYVVELRRFSSRTF